MRVMVLGIPNVGKSSLINRLSGTRSAKVEDRPGVTRGKQWVSLEDGVELLDMPGVLWPKFEDKVAGERLAFIGSVKDQILDIEYLAMRLLDTLRPTYTAALAERYKLDAEAIAEMESYELLERIARKRGMKVTISTAEEADFGCGDYDTILFNGTPSYITDLESVVRKAYDALPEGGRIILIDVPKESTYGVLYNLAKALGTWDHPLLAGTYPENPYPIEFVRVANWRTTAEKIELLEKAGFRDLRFAQTLTTHPLYSNRQEEQPSEGYEKGDYVAVTACK